MNEQAIIITFFITILGLSFFIILLLLIKKYILKSESKSKVKKEAYKFEKNKQNAKISISTGIQQVTTATTLLSINEGIVNANSGLAFLNNHNIDFGTQSAKEIKAQLESISIRKIKRLYDLY